MAQPKPKPKRTNWYNQIGINKKNFARLRKLREDLRRSMGISLSWNDFVGKMLPHMEAAVKKEISR